MSNVIQDQKFVSNVNGIRFYGGNSNMKDKFVPEAKASIVKLFNIPSAEMYILVGTEYVNDVIRLLNSIGYVFKTRDLNKYTAFALQYQRP